MIKLSHRLLDPEFVIPSQAGAAKTEFWDRMLGQANDRTSKLGPATLEALQNLAMSPPPSSAIAERDFWRIMTQFMSRGFVSSGPPRTVCGTHLETQYRPSLGHPDNLKCLLADMAALSGESPLLLMTLPDVWTAETAACPVCVESRLVRLTSDALSEPSRTAIARAWRTLFVSKHAHELALMSNFASVMFPDLRFHEDAWNHLGDLEGDEAENISKLTLHLGTLNDQATSIWSEHTETVDRQGALGSRGVTASPEGSNTRRTASKMRLRDFTIDGTLIRCEWHTKLRPNSNRIYFAVKDSCVYVGTIIDHLPT